MEYRFTAEDRTKARERPAMYLGSTGIRGVYYLVFSFIKEVIRESKKTNVIMELNLDTCGTICVICDFPAGVIDSLELDLVKAFSSDFDLYKGQDSIKLQFKPDKSILSYDKIEYHRLHEGLTELAQLNNNIEFLLTDCENRNRISFHHGLEAMLMEGVYGFGLDKHNSLNICFSNSVVEVSVSMIYAYASDVAFSYVNNDRTHDGGTHVNGLYDGLFIAFQDFIKTQPIDFGRIKDHPLFFLVETLDDKPYLFDKTPKITRDDVTEDLNFVISVKMNKPLFEGSVKRKLVNEEVYFAVKDGLAEKLKFLLVSDPAFFYNSRVLKKAELRKIELR
jgi:DNA gyrase subunit B